MAAGAGAVGRVHQLTPVRNLVVNLGRHGAHSDASLKLVGLDEPPASKPLAVYRQGEHILEKLRSPGLELPPPRRGATAVDPQGVADAMEPDVKGLGRNLEGLDRELKLTDESKVAKDAALKRHRRMHVNVARSQEAGARAQGF